MARTPKAKPAPAPEPEETDEGGAVRGPGEMHEIFAEWLKTNYDVDVSPEAVFFVTSKRTAFRKSDEYLAFAEGQDKLREEKAAQKEERAKARAAKPAPDEDEEEAKPARRRGKVKPTEETADEKVTPIRGGRRRGKPAPAEDTDADEAQATPAKPAARRRRSAPANF